MPIAIVLSPVIAWIPRVLARAFLVCLAVPLVWAICFAASGALLNDGLFLKGSSGFFDALLEPLAAIALLWLMLLLPTRLAQMAMLGAGAVSGGFVSRAVSYAAGSQLRDVGRQHLPGWAGGHAGANDQRSRGSDSRLGARLRAESALAASKAAGGGAAGTAARGCRGAGWLGSGRERCERRVQRRERGPGGLVGADPWCRESARVLATAAGGQGGRCGRAARSSAPGLAAGGLRRRDARGVAARAAPAGVGRAGANGPRGALARDAGGGGKPGRRSRPAGAAAPGLSGTGGMDAAGA